jgi:phosphatidylglycerol lysyltransferase
MPRQAVEMPAHSKVARPEHRNVTSKTLNRLTLIASLAVFLVAVYVLYRNLEHVRPTDVMAKLGALPSTRVAAALLLTAASYLLLTGYDYLALRFVNHMVPFRQFAPTSFFAFAFSHNVGLALVSGGSVRYRIYSGLGLGIREIAEVVVFCAFTYGLGITTVGGLLLSIDPADVAPILEMPEPLVRLGGAALLALGLVYLGATVLWRRPLTIGRYRLRLPSVGSGLAQVGIASIDLALAGAVVYVLLPPDVGVTYRSFLGIYVLAAAASILSHVPGGLGVFEAVIMVMLPDVPKAASMSALVAYRCIYFLLPLVLAMVGMLIYEVTREERKLGWLGRFLRRRRRVDGA